MTGIWCIADVQYEFSEDSRISPWILESLKPIQIANYDFYEFVTAREEFTLDEWIDVLMQTIGFDPEAFGRRSKLLQLMRLIPYVERNYNIIELGPNGTGKSHIYSEFSPHGQLISGGEVSVAKLFVNNSNGRIGLVGFWDVVAFDEFAGKDKTANRALVDIMKNYMANKSFSRGVQTMGAEASFSFVGNTDHNVPYMLKNSDLFEALPPQFHDSAFIDRIHAYLPGWEVDVIRGEMFTNGYGFIVDYLAEILRHLRSDDLSNRHQAFFSLSDSISTRDRDAINKTMSGLMKLLFPAGGETEEDVEELLKLAIECRKRVKDQLKRIDATYPTVEFSYTNKGGMKTTVQTLEEVQFPGYYHKSFTDEDDEDTLVDPSVVVDVSQTTARVAAESGNLTNQPGGFPPAPMENDHLVVSENQKGISFDKLFGQHLKGVSQLTLTDPYLRVFHQIRNLMEFIETVVKFKAPEDDVTVHIVTSPDDTRMEQQVQYLEQVQQNAESAGVRVTWEFDGTNTIHARHIVTDNGWKILLDRGLDVFQRFEMNDAFSLANRIQEQRACKAFEVTFVRNT